MQIYFCAFVCMCLYKKNKVVTKRCAMKRTRCSTTNICSRNTTRHCSTPWRTMTRYLYRTSMQSCYWHFFVYLGFYVMHTTASTKPGAGCSYWFGGCWLRCFVIFSVDNLTRIHDWISPFLEVSNKMDHRSCRSLLIRRNELLMPQAYAMLTRFDVVCQDGDFKLD